MHPIPQFVHIDQKMHDHFGQYSDLIKLKNYYIIIIQGKGKVKTAHLKKIKKIFKKGLTKSTKPAIMVT